MNLKKVHSQNYISTLINTNTDIKSYFDTHVNPLAYQTTIQDLLLQAIHYRNQIQNTNKNQIKQLKKQLSQESNQNSSKCNINNHNKHYQVAYIKQQRFLSPRQKLKERQNVTPKITEIVPFQSTSKHIIYGKPRVRIDNQGGCPQHGYDCPSPNKQSFNKVKSIEKNQVLKKNQHIQNSGDPQQQNFQMKSTQSVAKLIQPSKQIKKQNQKETQKNNRKVQTQFKSPQISKKRINQVSQKNPEKIVHINQAQKYKNVKSKIKSLVDKDKKEKKITEQLQKHKQKIQELERRQNYLTHHIVHQQQKKSFIKKNHQYQHHQKDCCYRKQQSSSSENSYNSDSSSQIDEELIRKYHKIKKNQEKKQIIKRSQNIKCDSSNDCFSCSCSRTLQNISDSSQDDQIFSKFDVKAFLANQRQYTPGYSGYG